MSNESMSLSLTRRQANKYGTMSSGDPRLTRRRFQQTQSTCLRSRYLQRRSRCSARSALSRIMEPSKLSSEEPHPSNDSQSLTVVVDSGFPPIAGGSAVLPLKSRNLRQRATSAELSRLHGQFCVADARTGFINLGRIAILRASWQPALVRGVRPGNLRLATGRAAPRGSRGWVRVAALLA